MTFPHDGQANKCDFPTAVKFLADPAGVASPSRGATGPRLAGVGRHRALNRGAFSMCEFPRVC